MTASSGNRVLVEGDDHPDPLERYVVADCGELFCTDTDADFTMAVTPVVVAVGETANGGASAITASFTAVGMTVAAAAGTFTINTTGLYEMYFCGRITGEDTEDVTLEWEKASVSLDVPHKFIKVFQSTNKNALIDECYHTSTISLVKNDVIRLGVLGSASEVISLANFNWGMRFLSSLTYDKI